MHKIMTNKTRILFIYLKREEKVGGEDFHRAL
jgi:hypothetical protein